MLTLTKKGHIAFLTLDRPERHNAFDDVLIAALIEKLDVIGNDSSSRVLLLGANGKSFCAGADLGWMQKMATFSREENIKDAEKLGKLMNKLFHLPIPTICLVQGAAYGGGVGLVAACDLVIAGPGAKFCLSEVKLGLVPAVISPYLVSALGARRAKRLSLTAETFSGAQAQEWGLVDYCVPSENELHEMGLRLAERLLKNGPLAMANVKKLIARVANSPLDGDLIEDTVAAIADTRAGAEAQEGLAAYFAKRNPGWAE